MPNDIKISLEKGNKLLEEKNNIELNSFINDYLKIENNINKINLIIKNINEANKYLDIKLKFFQENDEEINK